MAIEKMIELPSSVKAGYWVFVRGEIDIASGRIVVVMKSYVDKAAFDAGKTEIEGVVKQFVIPVDKKDAEFIALVNFLEEKVSVQSDFNA